MALRVLRPMRKPSWREVRERIGAQLDAQGVSWSASDVEARTGAHGACWIAWHEGPSIATVRNSCELPGWTWRAELPVLGERVAGSESTPGTGDPGEAAPSQKPDGDERATVWVRRTFAERTLAAGVVRFYASRGRYISTAESPRYLQEFGELMDIDDPAAQHFPLVDHIVDALLREPDLAPPSAGTAAIDVLSARLARLGYERLWARAFEAMS